jgi:hypothetical protein
VTFSGTIEEAAGLRISQAAWQLRVTEAEYRRLEAGEAWPDGETYDRILEGFGWPRGEAVRGGR